MILKYWFLELATSDSQIATAVSGLTKFKEYTFKLIPFNWDGSDITSAYYYTGGTIPTITITTVPTLGEWGMIAFASLMGIFGFVFVRKKIV